MAVQHILFPTDFSDPAQHAGGYAAALARATGARVTILHVMATPVPPSGLEPNRWLDLAREMAERELARVDEQQRALTEGEGFRGLSAGARVVTGLVEHEILEAIRREPVDLVVMGTHGRGPVGRAVLGGVTSKVVRLSPRPVLAVRWPGTRIRTPWGKVLVGAGLPAGGPRLARILVPLDGSPLAEGILGEVRALAGPLRATLLLVRAIERPAYPMLDVATVQAREAEDAAAYLDRVKAGLEADGFRAQAEVLTGDPARAILEQAAKVEAHVIAMTTHGRSGLDRWLLGSVAEKVLSGSEVPVLVYRAWAEAA
jgi:nucleotide-binding universal stress UspA family protein